MGLRSFIRNRRKKNYLSKEVVSIDRAIDCKQNYIDNLMTVARNSAPYGGLTSGGWNDIITWTSDIEMLRCMRTELVAELDKLK